MCYYYILFSAKLDNYYIGSTCDQLHERIRRHNTNHKGFTGKANDWKLMWHQSFEHRSAACAKERQLKKWKNRKRIEALIKRDA